MAVEEGADRAVAAVRGEQFGGGRQAGLDPAGLDLVEEGQDAGAGVGGLVRAAGAGQAGGQLGGVQGDVAREVRGADRRL